MQTVLPLDTMTTQDKLRAFEEIWNDLAHTPSQVPSPAWHGEELKAREKRLANGSTHFSDWSEAKQRIRGQTRCISTPRRMKSTLATTGSWRTASPSPSSTKRTEI